MLADFSHARPCKPFCENSLTLPLSVIRAILVELVDQLLRKVCTLG